MNYGGILLEPKTERVRLCSCGNSFAQWKLHPRSLEVANPGAQRMFTARIPEGYVPLFCPKCERDQLRLEAARDHMRLTYGAHE